MSGKVKSLSFDQRGIAGFMIEVAQAWDRSVGIEGQTTGLTGTSLIIDYLKGPRGAKEGILMATGKLRHIAISVPDKERAAKFYEETFGFERISQSRVATRLSDGVMNLTLLQFETEEDAGDERGKDFVGLHHFGIWVDDVEAMKRAIKERGGKAHGGPTGHVPENAEHKFRDPNGIVFDISTQGWDGAKR